MKTKLVMVLALLAATAPAFAESGTPYATHVHDRSPHVHDRSAQPHHRA